MINVPTPFLVPTASQTPDVCPTILDIGLNPFGKFVITKFAFSTSGVNRICNSTTPFLFLTYVFDSPVVIVAFAVL